MLKLAPMVFLDLRFLQQQLKVHVGAWGLGIVDIISLFTFESSIVLCQVPKCEIFDRSDFHDFYSIKPFWVGDFGAKI
jgi:hypothetical protein